MVEIHVEGLLAKCKSELMRHLQTAGLTEDTAGKLLDAYVELTNISNLPESEHERLLNQNKELV
jgi:hypothetical protein